DIENGENQATTSRPDVVELSIPSSLLCLPCTSKYDFSLKPSHPKDGKKFAVQVQFGTSSSSDYCPHKQPLYQQSQLKVDCLSLKELLQSHSQISDHINQIYRAIADQETKKRNYEADDQRRTHDYDEFTGTFFTMLLENGLLPENSEKPKTNRKRPIPSRRKSAELSKKRVKNV
uniref:Peptidase C12 C-terminal domain-containing protein n=1 Tax=Romanomermis culicivorax TaxID=13658 RepID=A0A915J870_ROMCU